jgi:hypothetical protein
MMSIFPLLAGHALRSPCLALHAACSASQEEQHA